MKPTGLSCPICTCEGEARMDIEDIIKEVEDGLWNMMEQTDSCVSFGSEANLFDVKKARSILRQHLHVPNTMIIKDTAYKEMLGQFSFTSLPLTIIFSYIQILRLKNYKILIRESRMHLILRE